MLVFLTITALSCKAQTPIISISSNYETDDVVDECYFKDTENKFSPYIGTWEWTNGNDTLTITIEKVAMVYENLNKYYSDYLIGKYKYVENGVEIINTLDYVVNSDNAWDNHPTYTNAMLTPMLGNYKNDSAVNFTFADYLKNKNEEAKFELLDLLQGSNGNYTATQAKLRLWNTEHWNVEFKPSRS